MTDCVGLLTNSHTLLLNARRYEKKKFFVSLLLEKQEKKGEKEFFTEGYNSGRDCLNPHCGRLSESYRPLRSYKYKGKCLHCTFFIIKKRRKLTLSLAGADAGPIRSFCPQWRPTLPKGASLSVSVPPSFANLH